MMKSLHVLCLLLISSLIPSLSDADETAAKVRAALANSHQWMPKDWRKGMTRLEEIGQTAIPELTRMLQEPDLPYLTHGHVCNALKRLPGDKMALPALRPFLHHSKWLLRSKCADAYGTIIAKYGDTSDEVVEPLGRLIRGDQDCVPRWQAADAVSPLPSPKLRQWFREHLFKGSQCDRKTAIFGLSRMGPPWDADIAKAFMRIIENSASKRLRDDATRAFRFFPYPPAKDLLLKVIPDDKNHSLTSRQNAIGALALAGHRDDLPLLRKIMREQSGTIWAVRTNQAMTGIYQRFPR